MLVQVNGKTQELEPGATVTGLLKMLGLGGTLVAVERNEEIVPRAQHESTQLSDGDEIEVVHFVGGG